MSTISISSTMTRQLLAILTRNCSTSAKPLAKPSKYVPKKAKYVNEINDYLQSSPFRKSADSIPSTFKNCNSCPPETLICIDSTTADTIADRIASSASYITSSIDRTPVLEMSPGPGLVSSELLKRGVNNLRLYEPNPVLNSNLQDLAKKNKQRVNVFPHDLNSLAKLIYVDQVSKSDNMGTIMHGIKRLEPPEITSVVVGACPNPIFVHLLPYMTANNQGFPQYGLTEYFLIVHPYNYLRMNAEPGKHYYRYRYHSVATQIFYNIELLEKLDRKSFLPWEKPYQPKQRDKQIKLFTHDEEYLYLLRLTPKKPSYELSPLEKQQLWYFLRYNLFARKAEVFTLFKKWIPECVSRLEQFGIDEKTCIGELSPDMLLRLFLAFIKWPEFPYCSFNSSMEMSFLKSNFNFIESASEKEQLVPVEGKSMQKKIYLNGCHYS
ncbi:dimethyladenosine transferase 2, mitochondrial isoform X2 [Cloeon dipterum]|uniref:dimethyladenosine transferase 2, mitochondrial isoform X2 n=1 Tax=Cloeon dipterum TaxID=197152 RepID=UPI0032206A67